MKLAINGLETGVRPRTVLITGASSGIGAALARHYAAPGARLVLSGRDAGRLKAVCGDCRQRGAIVEDAIVDVTNRDAMRAWVEEADDRGALDLVIANAGISGGTGGRLGETAEQSRQIFAINLNGVLNTIDFIIPRMVARGRGQVALMSSLASFSGWPGAPAYSASKAAVRVYGEALRGALAPQGVRVNVVCPGFIDTPMTAVNNYAMPFMMAADKAARLTARGLELNRGRIAYPLRTYFFAGLFGLIPPALNSLLLSRFPRKPARES